MAESAAIPERCTFQHPLFGALGEIWFRRAEGDETPVLTMRLGERNAALPLRSLQAEFGITNESPDGRMLGLVAGALDFVSCLRPGDRLPAEIRTGEASWEPEPRHFALAAARVKLQLTAWLGKGNADQTDADPQVLLTLADDPAMRHHLQEALARAAAALGLDGPDAVLGQVQELAGELGYVEALRERLLRPGEAMLRRLQRVGQRRLDPAHIELITQVQRLARKGVRDIGSRFEELDAQTGEVMAALQNLARQKRFIRGHRDWLYRSLRAWEPILSGWTTLDDTDSDQLWSLASPELPVPGAALHAGDGMAVEVPPALHQDVGDDLVGVRRSVEARGGRSRAGWPRPRRGRGRRSGRRPGGRRPAKSGCRSRPARRTRRTRPPPASQPKARLRSGVKVRSPDQLRSTRCTGMSSACCMRSIAIAMSSSSGCTSCGVDVGLVGRRDHQLAARLRPRVPAMADIVEQRPVLDLPVAGDR